MTIAFMYKVFFVLSAIVCLRVTCLADTDAQDRSKYKYGYVISHKGGSTQAHLESRDGNLALGRYYVNLHNGTGQKVTYFADDLGFHTGVFYSSQYGRGSSKTQIAMGQKALAAFGDSENQQSDAVTAKTQTLLFGKKILSAAINAVTPKTVPKLNYTPVPGGFYLTHASVETSNNTTEHPSYIAGLTSQAFSSHEGKYTEGISQSKANTQTFIPTSDNVKNGVKQLQIQPAIKNYIQSSIKSYSPSPPQTVLFSGPQNEPAQFLPRDQTVKVSTYATDSNDLSFSKQKSIEKNDFADIDAQIISEVQKHAEQIIIKDLKKVQNVNYRNDFSDFPGYFQPSMVTIQPIVVTNDGETGLSQIISTTPIPEAKKLSKNLQSETISSVKITQKNSDQALEDSGYFRVSLSPSLSSSINVSQTPHQSINVESTDLNSVSNNSTLCEFNLCEKDNQIFSIDLNKVKSRNEKELSSPLISDISDSSETSKVVHTFYPENKQHDERHYVTTIDVQKAISLDVNQNEANSINFAQNFPFNKIKPFDQNQNQFNENPTPQPVISNQILVTPGLFDPQVNLNLINTSPKPYILNTVTTAPGLFDATPDQNLAVLQNLKEVSSSQIQYNPEVQDRIGNNRLGYENQLVVPPAPVSLTNEAAEDFRQKQAEDLNQVEKSIQELRQQILSDIDAQHEEEQRKQNLVDEERKQYFENLKKVEALKHQNSVSYNANINLEANVIQATVSPSPISSVGNVNNVELVPQTQYVSPPQGEYNPALQPQYEPQSQSQYTSEPQPQYTSEPQPQYTSEPQPQYTSEPQPQYTSEPQPQYTPEPQPQYNQPVQNQYASPQSTEFDSGSQQQFDPPPQTFQTEIKDFTHEVAVPQASVQQIPNVEVYQKQVIPYIRPANGPGQYSIYNAQNAYSVDNSIQQSALAYTTEKIQLNEYVPQSAPVAFQTRYAVPRVTQPENRKVQLGAVNGQLSTIPVSFTPETISQPKKSEGKMLLLNRLVPFEYSRFLQIKQPVPLIQSYQIPLGSETKLSEIYPAAQPIALPVEIPQAYKIVSFPDIPPVSNKQYHSTLTQKPTNKLRIQPLKPSTPDEDSQREAVQNLLSQPQFHQTYYYPGLPFNNRLQLRHIRKNQISNSDQVRSQSVIRRGKSLKNLRIEYGFKPPLRPSVEFSEEVKPSIYGPSIPPQQ